MSDWRFSAGMTEEARAYYQQHGFVAFPELLTRDDVTLLDRAFDEAIGDGRIVVQNDTMAPNPDAIFRHPAFDAYCRDPRIVQIVSRLLSSGVELQHSKLNVKPGGGAPGGTVAWHQDFPFFPHTNFDLLACSIHLDAEDETSGPLEIIPGSHRWGEQRHEDDTGNFAYEYVGDSLDHHPSVLLTGTAGQVTMHHVLAMHRSAPRTSVKQRRHLVFEYRAEDAVQLAGVVTRCAGQSIVAGEWRGWARFVGGQRVKLRGKLIDLHGKFGPDR